MYFCNFRRSPTYFNQCTIKPNEKIKWRFRFLRWLYRKEDESGIRIRVVLGGVPIFGHNPEDKPESKPPWCSRIRIRVVLRGIPGGVPISGKDYYIDGQNTQLIFLF